MKLSVIRAYLKKEFLDILRSRIILLVYIMPSLITLLFGYGIRMEVTHARTLIIDHDGSKLSQTLRSDFMHSKYFDLLPSPPNEAEALASVRRGGADIVLILPESMERNLLKGLPVTLGLYLDGAFPSRASTMASYVQGVLLQSAGSIGAKQSQITLEPQFQFNRAMRDPETIIPGVMALAMLIAPAILAALLIAKEKETGTIFNFYASPNSSSPNSPRSSRCTASISSSSFSGQSISSTSLSGAASCSTWSPGCSTFLSASRSGCSSPSLPRRRSSLSSPRWSSPSFPPFSTRGC